MRYSIFIRNLFLLFIFINPFISISQSSDQIETLKKELKKNVSDKIISTVKNIKIDEKCNEQKLIICLNLPTSSAAFSNKFYSRLTTKIFDDIINNQNKNIIVVMPDSNLLKILSTAGFTGEEYTNYYFNLKDKNNVSRLCHYFLNIHYELSEDFILSIEVKLTPNPLTCNDQITIPVVNYDINMEIKQLINKINENLVYSIIQVKDGILIINRKDGKSSEYTYIGNVDFNLFKNFRTYCATYENKIQINNLYSSYKNVVIDSNSTHYYSVVVQDQVADVINDLKQLKELGEQIYSLNYLQKNNVENIPDILKEFINPFLQYYKLDINNEGIIEFNFIKGENKENITLKANIQDLNFYDYNKKDTCTKGEIYYKYFVQVHSENNIGYYFNGILKNDTTIYEHNFYVGDFDDGYKGVSDAILGLKLLKKYFENKKPLKEVPKN